MRMEGHRIPNDRLDVVIGTQCLIPTFDRQVKTPGATRSDRDLVSDILDSLKQEGACAKIAGICELGISNEDTVCQRPWAPPVLKA